MLARFASPLLKRTVLGLRAQTTGVLPTAASVDPEEVGRFSQLVGEWMDEGGSLKALHSFNRVRVPWILDELKRVSCFLPFICVIDRLQQNPPKNEALPLSGLRILDIGCGAGILSFPLARLGSFFTNGLR